MPRTKKEIEVTTNKKKNTTSTAKNKEKNTKIKVETKNKELSTTKKDTMKKDKNLEPVEVKIEKNKKKNGGFEKMWGKITKLVKKYKVVVISVLSIILIAILLMLVLPIVSMNTKVITIDGNDYKKSDFMIYLYSVKYSYFGKDNINVPEATLNTQINSSDDMTIREYLKEKTTSEIKTASAIKKIAKDNKIELSSEHLKELDKEKEKYISSIGGKSKFKKLLKDNNSTEEAYDNMAYTDKLYNVILEKLYSDGTKNDLTEKEKETAKNDYYSNYYKISQIILATVDLNTKEDLSETAINQKEALANSILNEANNGINFDELIKKYSENANELEAPYSTYYKKGELLEELEEVVDSLSDGSISNVIKTNYAFHIIKKETLDDGKLEDFYNKKREEKLLKSVSENIEKISIIYQNSYERIKIK